MSVATTRDAGGQVAIVFAAAQCVCRGSLLTSASVSRLCVLLAVINITISSTYSSISTVALKELWNLSDKKAFEELVATNGWTLAEEGKTVVLRATPTKEAGAAAAAAATQRAEQPSIEQLAKLITAA